MNTNQLHSRAFAATPDPLLLAGENGRVLLANAAAHAFFDVPEGCLLSQLTCRDQQIGFDSGKIAALAERNDEERALTITGHGHAYRVVVVDVEPAPGDLGERLQLVQVCSGGAEARGDFWKDEMISMVSHEIKNPLSAMKQSVDVLLSQLPGELTPGQRRFLDASGRNIDRLTHMLDGYLDVSRINSGALEVERRAVDMGDFVARTVESFQTLFNVKRVELGWRVEEGAREAFVDAHKLEQVLINLLSNALKFTPAGGRIDVLARVAGIEAVCEERRLLPWHEIGSPRLLELQVRDTGLGMSGETLEGAFDRFAKPALGNVGPASGSHLGLNISRALVEAQGGWLDVESRIGMGTTVTVHVPRDRRTQCVFARIDQVSSLLRRYEASRRRAAVLVVGKYSDDNWNDICGSWNYAPVTNARRKDGSSGRFHLWTLSDEIAVAVFADPGDDVTIERLVSPNFVQCDNDCYVFRTWAIGVVRAPEEAQSATQAIAVAMSRMRRTRNVMAHATIEAMHSGIECVMDGERMSEP